MKDEGEQEIEIKYITLLKGLVNADDEKTTGGQVIGFSGKGVSHSDKVLLMTVYSASIGKGLIEPPKSLLIALRTLDAGKQYKFYQSEGTELIAKGSSVGFSESNISSIPDLDNHEVKVLQTVMKDLREGAFHDQGTQPATLHELGHMLGAAFKKDAMYDTEKYIQDGSLAENLRFIVTKDKRVPKDQGALYKVYFFENDKLLKKDSVVLTDKSDPEKPEIVYDVIRKTSTCFLLRLTCKPLTGEKSTYYRYILFDKMKPAKQYRFQLPGKLSAFEPERTFLIGDTLIHLTSKKAGFLDRAYESSIFIKDSVQLIFPKSHEDTIKRINVTCNVRTGTSSFFGSDRQYIFSAKVGNSYFIGEQEAESKASAGITKMDAPDANEQGYSMTRVYLIQDNAVKKIFKIRVSNFSKTPSGTQLLFSNSESANYLVQLDAPIIFTFSSTGNIKLKNGDVPGYKLKYNLSGVSYSTKVNGNNYLIYQATASDKLRLVKLEL